MAKSKVRVRYAPSYLTIYLLDTIKENLFYGLKIQIPSGMSQTVNAVKWTTLHG